MTDKVEVEITAKDEASKTISGIGGALSGLGKVGGVITAGGIAAAGAGIAVLSGFFVSSTKSAIESEDALAALNAVILSTGGAAGVTSESAQELANNLQTVTKFSDETIMAGETTLLQFTNIGKDVFPAATEATLNLAQRLGMDVPSAARLLGKALETPGEGLMRLKMAGVSFTDEQTEMIKTMTEAGDTTGAQKLILGELEKSLGGAARAAGETTSGQLVILGNAFDNIKETIGGAILPVLTKLSKSLIETLSRPEIQAAIQNIITGIADFAGKVAAYLPIVLQGFKDAFGWLEEHQGVVVAALAAIGVALVAFAVTTLATVIPAIAAVVVAAWPVLAIMAAVAAVAYVVYEAWTNNWGGIQEKTQAVLGFIGEFIGSTIEFIKGVWEGFLSFIGDLTSGKLGWLSKLWTTTVGFIQTTIKNWVVIIKAIFAAFSAAFHGDWYAFGEQLRIIWNTVWKQIGEALTTAWTNIKTIISGIITGIVGFFTETDWGEVGKNIIQGIANGITAAVGWLADAAKKAAQAALDAAKGFLGIKSPSTVFEIQVGRQMGAGIQKGLLGSVVDLVKSMPRILSPIIADGSSFPMREAAERLSRYPPGRHLAPVGVTVQVYANVANGIDVETMAYRVADVIARRLT